MTEAWEIFPMVVYRRNDVVIKEYNVNTLTRYIRKWSQEKNYEVVNIRYNFIEIERPEGECLIYDLGDDEKIRQNMEMVS